MLILVATRIDVILIRSTKINMAVTLLTTCAVIWLIRTIYITFLGVSSSILAWNQASQSGKRTQKSLRLRRAERKFGRNVTAFFPSPVHRSALSFSLTFYVCRFILFFAIFPHIWAFSYEVAWVSGHPKGVKERRFFCEIKTPSHVVTSFSLNHIISACASGHNFLSRLSSYEVVLK